MLHPALLDILSQLPQAVAQAGRAQARTSVWPRRGSGEHALWGECQGSGAKPYQCAIDLRGPRYRCSCPSRQFPCKHAIGLLILASDQPHVLTESTPPEWAAPWFAKGDTPGEPISAAEEPQAVRHLNLEAAAKRRTALEDRRSERQEAGMEELRLWLMDVVRHGLASEFARQPARWSELSRRMVDAQAPGIASRLRRLADLIGLESAWHEQAVEQMGLLWLLIEAAGVRGDLPEDLAAEVENQVGKAVRQEELLHQPGVRDVWLVAGRQVERDDRLMVQRTWVFGLKAQEWLMHLSFAVADRPLDRSLVPGTMDEMEWVKCPGLPPCRALLKDRANHPLACDKLPGHKSISGALAQQAQWLRNPWQAQAPLCLTSVIPVLNGKLSVVDAEGRSLECAAPQQAAWKLIALSGGEPLTLFGEWSGRTLTPLSACADSRFIALDTMP